MNNRGFTLYVVHMVLRAVNLIRDNDYSFLCLEQGLSTTRSLFAKTECYPQRGHLKGRFTSQTSLTEGMAVVDKSLQRSQRLVGVLKKRDRHQLRDVQRRSLF